MIIPFLSLFLEGKPFYYREIDHERVHDAYRTLRRHIKHPKTIHIVGTNGKGSTGRMIAHLAHLSGLQTGHFSSPHILKFNERIWLNGGDSSDEILESAHQKLYEILGCEKSEALSYFEYTTLLALVVFEKLDLVILEAGLGGEYDATNVCDKSLSVIVPIGIDHQAFLGETIEEIASTKIRSIQRQALLAPQVYPEVLEIAEKIATEKGAKLYISSGTLSLFKQDRIEASSFTLPRTSSRFLRSKPISLAHTSSRFLTEIAIEKSWPDYLQENAAVSLQALDLLDINYDINNLKELELFGRFYPLTRNIRIDVGHNPLAAKAIVKALSDEVVLIYNSLDDKEYETVLRILKPKVKRVEIIPIASERAVTMEAMREALECVDLPYCNFRGKLDDDENYLVFGSFYTVEAFLRSVEKRANVPK